MVKRPPSAFGGELNSKRDMFLLTQKTAPNGVFFFCSSSSNADKPFVRDELDFGPNKMKKPRPAFKDLRPAYCI